MSKEMYMKRDITERKNQKEKNELILKIKWLIEVRDKSEIENKRKK